VTDEPLEPAEPQPPEASAPTAPQPVEPEEPAPDARESTPDVPERRHGSVVLGLVFVVLGALFLLDEIWPDFLAWKYIWPIALIAVGVAILLRGRR